MSHDPSHVSRPIPGELLPAPGADAPSAGAPGAPPAAARAAAEPPAPAVRRRDPLLSRALADVEQPGVMVEVSPEAARALGAFEETALTDADAWDANADLVELADRDAPPAADVGSAGGARGR